jgi:hypothetical protein
MPSLARHEKIEALSSPVAKLGVTAESFTGLSN